VVVVLGVLFASVDQRRLVPLVLPKVEFAVDFVSVLIVEETAVMNSTSDPPASAGAPSATSV